LNRSKEFRGNLLRRRILLTSYLLFKSSWNLLNLLRSCRNYD